MSEALSYTKLHPVHADSIWQDASDQASSACGGSHFHALLHRRINKAAWELQIWRAGAPVVVYKTRRFVKLL